MKQKWIDSYMDTDKRFASLSSAKRLKVGAVVVKDNRIISIGYNGTPSGFDNTCEDTQGATKPEVIHAEANCLLKLAKTTGEASGSTLFCTHSPCIECAKLILISGISTVYYIEKYRNSAGIDFLEKANIKVINISDI